MAGTTGFEPATSDVTGRTSQRLLVCMSLIAKDLLRTLESCFSGATVRATVRSSRLFLWKCDFAIDQLHRLLTKLREEMLVPFQLPTLMTGVLGNYVVRHSFC
jgi:hypothetical protein